MKTAKQYRIINKIKPLGRYEHGTIIISHLLYDHFEKHRPKELKQIQDAKIPIQITIA